MKNKQAKQQLNSNHVQVQQKILPLIESYFFIDIDLKLNEASLSKQYKWITSLQLISSQKFQQKLFHKDQQRDTQDTNKKSQNHTFDENVLSKHVQIDKLLYLVVKFCQEGKLPITRIRTRKQASDEDWIAIKYPPQFQKHYQHHICYQHTQSKQCKRIITDLQVCHSKDVQLIEKKADEWEIATIPQMQYQNYMSQSKIPIQRMTKSSSDEFFKKNSNQTLIRQSSAIQQNTDSKLSERSWMRENNSNISQTSYYSCTQVQGQKVESQQIQKQIYSDIDQRVSPSQSNQMSTQRHQKSSLSEFHSIQQISGPFYFLMKTIDLYDVHKEFQYSYNPKIKQIYMVQENLTKDSLSALIYFCFPNGIQLYKQIQGPGYSIFTLVLTLDTGQRYFVYCLKYKQIMDPNTQKELLSQLYQLNLIDQNQLNPNRKIYSQKAFCLVSKVQNTDSFHKILQKLYQAYISFSSSNKGEQFFGSVKNSTQNKRLDFFANDLCQNMTKFSKRRYQQKQRQLLKRIKSPQLSTSPTKSKQNHFTWCNLSTEFPIHNKNKVSMKALYCFFKLLSVDNIFKILEAALVEKKIFFVSNIQISICFAIEALLGLVYPLRFSQPIIPIINSQFIDYIKAPMPIIAGLTQEFVNEETQTEAIYVFLDINRVLIHDVLPDHAPNFFVKNKNKILSKYSHFYNLQHINELMNFQQKIYPLLIHQKTEYNSQIHRDLKHIFKQTILQLLKDYSNHYTPLNQNIPSKQKNQINSSKQKEQNNLSKQKKQQSQKHLTFKQLYNCNQFIVKHHKKQHKFYKQFCNSSAFSHLIQQKYLNPLCQQIVKIDKCLQELQENLFQYQFSKQYSCFSINIPSGSIATRSNKKIQKKDKKIQNRIHKIQSKNNQIESKNKQIHHIQSKDKQIQCKEKQIQCKDIQIQYIDNNINIKNEIKFFINPSLQHLKASCQNSRNLPNKRVSLTDTKQQIMKKNLSHFDQQKIKTKKSSNISNVKKNLKLNELDQYQTQQNSNRQEKKNQLISQYALQRYSQGGFNRQQFKNQQQMQQFVIQIQETRQQTRLQKTVASQICSLVENVTKKVTNSSNTLVGIFSQAKVNRLKKVYKQQSLEKNKKSQISTSKLNQKNIGQSQISEHKLSHKQIQLNKTNINKIK